MQTKPAESHRRGLRVILREVEKMQFNPWVGERHSLAIRGDNGSTLDQRARREWLGQAGLSRVVVMHDV
jgi:hypothetical protein